MASPVQEEEITEPEAAAPERFTSYKMNDLKQKVTSLIQPFLTRPEKEKEFSKQVDSLLMQYIGSEVNSNRLELLIKLNNVFETFVEEGWQEKV